MYKTAENIETTVHHLPDPDPILKPMLSGPAVVTRKYKFGYKDRWATTRVISSNPNAPIERYDYPF